MTKKYIAPLSLIALCLAALYATLSDTDRARLFNAAQAKTDQLAAAMTSKPIDVEAEIETEWNETEIETEVVVSNLELCTQVSTLAETIMQNRQSGVPMSAMMEVVPADSLATTLVIDAYDYPRLSIKSNQDDYIRDFADQAMLDCYKTMEASS
jgi:hypothetical protein